VQGSGKTLAFGLPILQLLLAERDALSDGLHTDAQTTRSEENQDKEDVKKHVGLGEGSKGKQGGGLRALILAPTRELAMQVSGMDGLFLRAKSDCLAGAS
jgi:superfamily II DNA/RNA helicase